MWKVNVIIIFKVYCEDKMLVHSFVTSQDLNRDGWENQYKIDFLRKQNTIKNIIVK